MCSRSCKSLTSVCLGTNLTQPLMAAFCFVLIYSVTECALCSSGCATVWVYRSCHTRYSSISRDLCGHQHTDLGVCCCFTYLLVWVYRSCHTRYSSISRDLCSPRHVDIAVDTAPAWWVSYRLRDVWLCRLHLVSAYQWGSRLQIKKEFRSIGCSINNQIQYQVDKTLVSDNEASSDTL